FCVPLAAHITTVPFSIRYASGLMAVLFWPLKENDSGVEVKRACLSAFFAVASLLISQEVGTASILGGGAFFALKGNRRVLKMYGLSLGATLFFALVAMEFYSGLANFLESFGVGAAGLMQKYYLRFFAFDFRVLSTTFKGNAPWWRILQQEADAMATILLLFSCPLAFLMGMMGWVRKQKQAPILVGFSFYGLCAASSAWGRPDRWHIYFALSPVLLLWAYISDQWLRESKRYFHRAATGILFVIVLSTVPHYIARLAKNRFSQVNSRRTLIARMGSSALPFPQADGYEFLVQWIQNKTKPGEPILFFPYDGSIFFLSNRPSPTRYGVLVLDTSLEAQVGVVREFQRSSFKWLIWDHENTVFEGLPVTVRLAPIYAYLMARFVERERIGPFSFLERRQDGSNS